MAKERKKLITIITIALLVVTSIVLINILKPKAESVDHTHIWTTTYDDTNHWEYCTICKITRNVTAHTYTDNWILGYAGCHNHNYSNRLCDCGYSYKYVMSHTPGTNWYKTSAGRGIHYNTCAVCGGWYTSARCSDAEGYLSCKNTGTCTVCNTTINENMHYISGNGTCRDCGVDFFDFESGTVTYNSDYTEAYVTFSIIPKHSSAKLTGAASAWTGTSNYSSVTVSTVDLANGGKQYTMTYKFNSAKQQKCNCNLGDSSNMITINGQATYLNTGGLSWSFWQDHYSPTISKIDELDQTSSNDWATIKQLTISGTENLSNIVYITIKDKETGTIYLNRAATTVTNNSYSYMCTPQLEADTAGRTYIVEVVDIIGNKTTKEFTIYKTDGSAPQLNSPNVYTNWSGTKTIKLDFLDYGSKGVQLSFNNQTSYVDLPTSDGTTYTWSKTFNTPQSGSTIYKIYVKDGLGNATVYNLTVGNIDTLKPTINKVTSTTSGSNLKVTITASDDLSGVTHYAVTNSTSVPTSWSTSNTVTVAASNAKYVWVKDAAGNTRSKPLLKLTATADNGGNGLINLDWSNYTVENTIFKGYQSKDNGATWQSISLMDYTSVNEVKVLQVYPVADAANQLKTWMETNGYGKGIIKVDSVLIDTFNSNPGNYLKKTADGWNYDVIFFGTWDSNGGKDLNATSYAKVKEFIQDGMGCIFAHDTTSANLKQLQVDFGFLTTGTSGLTFNGSTYNNGFGVPAVSASSNAIIMQTGLITTYPWNIGDVGTVLTVPATHSTTNMLYNGTIWLKFYNDNYTDANYGDATNVYVATYNNLSKIQTGHSSGAATVDEQKILANLIFQAYQLSTSTSIVDHSAMDVSKPTKPSITVSGTTYKFASSDTGTKYLHKIEAYNKSNLTSVVDTSNTTTTTVMTGLKEYRYLFSNDANTVLTATTGTAVATTTAQVSNSANAADYKYLHVVAVDNTGNVSDTMTIDLKRTVTVKHYQLTVTGTKPSTPFATETYQVIANTSFKAPVKTYTGFTSPTQKTVTVGDGTVVEYEYSRINYQNKFKHILTGVNYNFITTIGEAVYGQEYTIDSSYSVEAPNGVILRPTFTSDYNGTKTTYSLGSKFTQPAKILNNEIYYDPVKYDIVYNLDGGTNNSSNPSTYTVIDKITFATPTKKGYDFFGWYLDPDFTKPITGINEGTNNNFTSAEDMYTKLSTRSTGTVTVYAKFIIHDYKITTNIKSGVGVVSDISKVEYLTNTAVIITTGNGHKISKIEVDGVEINFNQGSQTVIKEFSEVEADHVVNVWFEAEDSWKTELDTYHKYEWIDLKFN